MQILNNEIIIVETVIKYKNHKSQLKKVFENTHIYYNIKYILSTHTDFEYLQ